MASRTPFASLNVNTPTPRNSTYGKSKTQGKHTSAMRIVSEKNRMESEVTPITKKRGRVEKDKPHHKAESVAKKQGIVPNDEEIIEYPNGDKYSGQVKEGKKHGFGTFISHEGYKYSGDFKDDEMHGSGVYLYENGDAWTITYDPSGQSRLTIEYASKDRTDLTFDNITGVGHGKTVYANDGEYDGSYLNGQPHGAGYRTYGNQDQFEGEFEEGKIKKGFYKFSNGSTYRGNMPGGVPHGRGILSIPKLDGGCSFLPWEKGNYAAQTTYIGSFEHGRFKGSDNEIHSASGEKYVGDVDREMAHGKGKLFFRQGGSFEGEFKWGKKHGTGLLRSTPWDRLSKATFEHDTLVTTEVQDSSSE